MSNLKLKTGAVIQKNSNIFLAGLGIGLGGLATFLAYRGGKQAASILAERDAAFKSGEDPNSDVITPPGLKERFDLTWKCWTPAVIASLFSAGCMVGSTYISWKAIAGLTGTLGAIVAERDRFEAMAREKFGDEAVDEIKKKVVEGMVNEEKVKYVKVTAEETGNGDLLCYDKYSGRWFRSSEEAVIKAENDLNEYLLKYEYASLGDLHSLWGLETCDFAIERGWFKTEYDENVDEEGVHFRHIIMRNEEKGEDILIIEIEDEPYECYYEY